MASTVQTTPVYCLGCVLAVAVTSLIDQQTGKAPHLKVLFWYGKHFLKMFSMEKNVMVMLMQTSLSAVVGTPDNVGECAENAFMHMKSSKISRQLCFAT